MTRRAVVTGIGVVAATGVGSEAHWAATTAGRSGIRRITRFDPARYATQLAGEAADFRAEDFIEQRLIVQTDRWTWMDLAATRLALDDAGFDPAGADPYAMSAITASASGGNEFGQREIQNLWGKGPLFVGAYQSIAWFYAASTGQISIRHGLKGPNGVVVAEGAGGLAALWESRRTIRRGSDVVVGGGSDAPITPYALVCQMQSGRLSAGADPATAYRPFDAGATGYVPGEGGAILLIEELTHAQARGARIYGEIAGYGATHDGHHPADFPPDGEQFARAISLALASAGLGPEDIDVIFADAAGTPQGDAREAEAIRSVFGDRAGAIPVTAPKTMTGRLAAGGGALDAATALLAMRGGLIPPTVGLTEPAPGCELNIVTGAAQPATLNTVLLAARGFGGFNSALVLRRYAG